MVVLIGIGHHSSFRDQRGSDRNNRGGMHFERVRESHNGSNSRWHQETTGNGSSTNSGGTIGKKKRT